MQGGKTCKHLDETACGPLCQHPLCWASNRRVERGLPRLVDAGRKNSETYNDDLPTLKIVDMFGGLPEPRHHGRSSSAPLLANASCGTTPVKSPLTPTASPAVNLSASFSKGKKQPLKPPPLKKVEVHEIVDWSEDWSDNFVGSHFYLWCSRNDPSKRRGQIDTKFIQSTGCLSSSHPDHVHIKDVTEDMLPPSSVKTKDKKQKTKKHGSHRTPTGGRPYTHPSRGQVPRSYAKSPREDEVSQLLSLPREVLLQVIEHANTSDIYDKNRVHTLLEKVLPQIHFQQHILARQKQLEKNRNAAGTPLEESGILQNKKVQLKEGPKQTMEQALPIPIKSSFLDGNVSQEKADNAEAPKEEKKVIDKVEEMVEASNPERDTKVEEGVTNLQKKSLAPLKGAKVEGARSLTKLTSVSARTLSPLHPGTGPTKPFNYSAKPLDWTLGPVPSIEKKVVLKPVTPTHSEKASTLYVTIPSVMSPDRMSLVRSITPMDRSPCPPCRTKSPYQQSAHSSLATEENPIHAISPSLSANPPLTPLGTPAPVHKEASFSNVTSKTSTNNQFENHTHGSLPKTPVNTPFHAGHQQTPEPTLGTIQERTISPFIIENVKIQSGKQRQSPVPLINNNRSRNISPWEEFNSIAAQPSEKINASPVPVVTPALTGMTTPDLWPSVDEHAYLDSPEKLVEEILAPAAPPPSPEPVDIESDSTDERQDIPKSVVTTSLTPLQEEEEEEEVAEETEVTVNEIQRDEKEESVTKQPITTEIGYASVGNEPDGKEAKDQFENVEGQLEHDISDTN